LLGPGQHTAGLCKAMKLLHQAARLGHDCACFDLGQMYREGKGCPKNDEKALEYFEEAARRGASPALAYFEMADIFARKGQFQNALKCWEKYFSSPPLRAVWLRARKGYRYFEHAGLGMGIPLTH